MLIYIVRHGETDANRNGILQGQIDNPLNKNGIKLAEITGDAMKGIKFDAAYSSPLVRAKLTARIILEHSGNSGIPVFYDDRLMEVNVGEYEGVDIKPESSKLPPEVISSIYYDFMRYQGYPGGESAYDVINRTQEFLKELAAKDHECVLVSMHGCALRGMLNMFYENKEDFWQGRVPYNLAVNVVEVKDGEMNLIVKDRIYYDENDAVDYYE